MDLDRVTITGPDDSISPDDLISLSKDFPFVEWGILTSESSNGHPRFPSLRWHSHLKRVARIHNLKLSLHLCGFWVRRFLLGDILMPVDFTDPIFQRMQLNFHAERTPCDPRKFFKALLAICPRQFIFQIDGANGNKHLEAIYGENNIETVDAVPLFDISGGAGILPTEWPKPEYMSTDVDHCYHGYAGGLGPGNLAEQLPLIGKAAGETRIWIDMETRVRSDDDRQFDLAKVRRCLEIAAPFVTRREATPHGN